jgi:hypothetical protein
MLVLLVALVSELYIGPILFFIFSESTSISDSISITVTILTFILPLINIVYAIFYSKRINNDEEKVKKWNKNILIIKIALIPFFIFNFVLWFLVSILGIVPVFMFLLVVGPITGIISSYWILLSTSFYSVAVIREYHKFGYLTKTLKTIFIISQFLLVCDLIGYVVLQFIIKNKIKV